MTTTIRSRDTMTSPSAVAANLASLLYLARHQSEAAEELEEAARVFLASAQERSLMVESTGGWLSVNGRRVPSGSPGAAQVNEHLMAHRVERLELAPDSVPADAVAVARVLAAYPGAFSTWDDLVAALGPARARVRLSEARSATSIVHFSEATPLTPDEEHELLAVLHTEPMVDEGGLIPPAEPIEPPEAPPPPPPKPAPKQNERERLADLVTRGRSAVEAGDWNRLLDVLAGFMQAETEASGDASARVYRLEMRRLLSRNEIAQLARLAALGRRRDEAIQVLRRLGPDATEVLMDLLVESEALAERRGYYSALTRMSDGTDIIIHHLGHPLWYVARNAAELCGEMGLAKAIPELARLTTHPDERVRRSVAAALTRIGSAEAMEPLARMLKDQSSGIRLYVIGNLDGERARPLAMPLALQLQQEDSPDVVRETLRALGRIGTPDALMALRNVAAGEVKRLTKKHRLQAVESLGLAGPGAAPILTALAKDPDRELASAAQKVLASLSS